MHLGSETRNTRSSRYAMTVMYLTFANEFILILKIQHDKLRRKALLGPASVEAAPLSKTPESHPQRISHNGGASGAVLDMSIGGLEASSGVWLESSS